MSAPDPEQVPLGVARPDDVADWKLHLLGAFLVMLVILLLHTGPFSRPEFWAEDGSELLAGALRDGVWSCFQPVASTFIVLPRLIASVAVLVLPLEWAPAAFAWTSLVVAAVVLGSIVRREMSWIHPDARWRLGIVGALATVPALAEVSMALCNGSYVFGLAGLLLAMRDRPRFGGLGAVLMALLMLSTPIGMLVPLVWAWRALAEPAERQVHLRYLAASLLPLGLIVMAAFIPFTIDTGLVYLDPPPSLGRPSFEPLLLLEIFASRLIILVVGLPWLGLSTTTGLMRSGPFFWLLLVPAVLALRALWQAHPRLFVGVCLGALIFPLMHLGRNYGAHLSLAAGQVFPIARWSLVGEAFAIMGYVSLLGRASRQVRWLALMPVAQFLWCASLPNPVSSSWVQAPDLAFTPVARIIEAQRDALAAGRETEVLTPIIPVHPHGWAEFRIKLE